MAFTHTDEQDDDDVLQNSDRHAGRASEGEGSEKLGRVNGEALLLLSPAIVPYHYRMADPSGAVPCRKCAGKGARTGRRFQRWCERAFRSARSGSPSRRAVTATASSFPAAALLFSFFLLEGALSYWFWLTLSIAFPLSPPCRLAFFLPLPLFPWSFKQRQGASALAVARG